MQFQSVAGGTRTFACLAVVVGIMVGVTPILPQNAAADEPAPKKQPAKDAADEKTPEKKDENGEEKKTKMPALQYKMNDINGKAQDLAQYHGNVVLMVNVASECGLTPQYEGLQSLYEKYKDQGFVILGFPANNFGKQEPGTNDEIKSFCKENFGVTFPMFSKVSVKGKDKCELYQYLTDKKADHKHGGEIKWNFAKFIVDRNGNVATRFSPMTKPDNDKFIAAVEKELKAAIPEDSALAKQRKDEEKKKPAPSPAP